MIARIAKSGESTLMITRLPGFIYMEAIQNGKVCLVQSPIVQKKRTEFFSVVLNGGIAKVQKPQIDFLRFLCYNSGMGIDDAFVIQMRNWR